MFPQDRVRPSSLTQLSRLKTKSLMSFTFNCCPCQWPDSCVSEFAKVLRDMCKCCWRSSPNPTSGTVRDLTPSNSVRGRTLSNIIGGQAPSNSAVGRTISSTSGGQAPSISVGGPAPSNTTGGRAPTDPVESHIQNSEAVLIVAGDLQIKHSGDPEKWTWKSLPEEPRFKKVAELHRIYMYEIKMKIKLAELSPSLGTTYAVYLIFKIAPISEGLSKWQQARVAVSNSNQEKKVCVNPTGVASQVELPVSRSDGWMEVELGQFYFDDDAGDTLVVYFEDNDTGYKKKGLIVAGIEVRPISVSPP